MFLQQKNKKSDLNWFFNINEFELTSYFNENMIYESDLRLIIQY